LAITILESLLGHGNSKDVLNVYRIHLSLPLSLSVYICIACTLYI
jgi:hypothetical protein